MWQIPIWCIVRLNTSPQSAFLTLCDSGNFACMDVIICIIRPGQLPVCLCMCLYARSIQYYDDKSYIFFCHFRVDIRDVFL